MRENRELIAPGSRLGPYEIESALGSGGMGEVYKARDTRLDRTVAIKILSPQLADSAQFRQRFEREARVISQLNHPHICTLYDVGEHGEADSAAGRVSYLVMELCEGETLAERLERGAVSVDQALTYAIQIAGALDKAHRKGIVHGDLKPGNVMLTKEGVKLLDFGLAIERNQTLESGWSDAATGQIALDEPGVLLGTLQYLAPEQLEGRNADERADIFALGAIVYEMVTGRKAFAGESPAAVIAAIMRHQPPRLRAELPQAPESLEHVVSTCLAKDPDDRWQSAADIAHELRWVAAGGALAPADAGRPTRLWLAMGTVSLLLLLMTVLAFAFLRRPETDPPAYRSSILLPEGLRLPAASVAGGTERFAISPDGRRLAFVANDPNGNQMLWLRPLESMTAVPLAGTDGASSPFWSPDSRLIAFTARGQLKTVDPAGGSPLVIATRALGTTGAWNQDNVILFTPALNEPLHRVPSSGGTPTPVTTLDAAAGDVRHRSPVFLPDGNHFLYVAVSDRGEGGGAPRAVYVSRLDAPDSSRVVLDHGSTVKYSQGHLLFARENMLLAQAFDPGDLASSGEPRTVAEQVELAGPSSAAFSVSSTGVLVFQTESGGSQLVWFDRDGRQLDAVGDAAHYGDLDLSPDGRRAAVSVLDPTRNTRDLWILDLERGLRTRFTSDPADDVVPLWSPDGSRIVFTSNRRGYFDLYQKETGGVGSEQVVLAGGTDKYPTSWFANGSAVLFWTWDADGTNLSVVSLAGEDKPEPFMGSPAGPGRFSPDGRFVAYYSAESGRTEVYVVPYPVASRKWQVSTAGGSLPRWSSDGREIFYVGRDNRLMAVSVDTTGPELAVGSPRPLFDARPVGPRSFYDVSQDGQRFLVNVLRGEGLSSALTLVQNWTAALRP